MKIVSNNESSLRKQATDTPVIEIAAVSKIYRTHDGEIPSVSAVDLSVNDGEFVVIVGPSGCGKTTLLKMISGLLLPSEGEVRVEGKAITKPHGNVGIVFQSAMLLPWRNVLKNVMMPVEVKKLPVATFEARARALLKLTGLEGFENKYPWQLSGGMQQRVSICRARSEDCTDGRAVRSSRCHDQRAHERRTNADSARDKEDYPADNSFNSRGGISGQSRRRHDASSGEDRRHL
jgi:ABC-type glutathione transport system ATPase component